VPRREHTGGAPATQLLSGINAAAMSFTVKSGGGTGYPTGGIGSFIVALDGGTALEEKILCASRSGDVFTVASSGRGYDNTLAVDHAADASVTHVLGAIEIDEANVHINTGVGVHGRTSQLASISDAETLSNKTINTSDNNITIDQADVTGLVAALAAKLAVTAVHDTWEAIIGAAPGTNWQATLAAALGAGWSTKLAATENNFNSINRQVFTADGTWTKPAGAKFVLVRIVGGGGAAGGAPATGAGQMAAGAGGGAGGYGEKLFAASALGATEAVDIGLGGNGVSGGTGNNGSASAFGSGLGISGNGGLGGAASGVLAISLNSAYPGGAGGTGQGDVTRAGGRGSPALLLTNGMSAGHGGDSMFGAGGEGVASAAGAADEAGGAGTGFGAGGGGPILRGAQSARGGAAGSSGVCIVDTFI
jgi:hypothetical protein